VACRVSTSGFQILISKTIGFLNPIGRRIPNGRGNVSPTAKKLSEKWENTLFMNFFTKNVADVKNVFTFAAQILK
jgi:hypothetical protein